MTRRAFALAFTLVELLVVIAIMVTLMSLIMGGVMLAKRSAMRAKTVSLISAVASAIDQYRSLNNTYPERLVLPADAYGFTAGVPDLYEQALAGKAVSEVDWAGVNQALIYQLADLIREQAPTGQALDPYKQPLRYRPSKWYPYDPAATARIDGENPPGQDSYQLWSTGPDGKDDPANPGEGGDDIPQWAKQ